MTSISIVNKVQYRQKMCCLIFITDKVMPVSSHLFPAQFLLLNPYAVPLNSEKNKHVILLLKLAMICQTWCRIFDSLVNFYLVLFEGYQLVLLLEEFV